ncbi:MAG TPA: luciferase family protein [Anaerolineales bacterium]
MPVPGAARSILETLSSWEGVTINPHRFGGSEFRLGTREIGHIHGDALVDIPFPKKMRDEIVSAGEAEPHHVLPDTGWVSFYLREPADVERALALLRRSYEVALRQRGRSG